MGKALRKPRPSAPRWHYLDNDGCWHCPFSQNQKGCSNCKDNKQVVADQKKKRNRIEKQNLRCDK